MLFINSGEWVEFNIRPAVKSWLKSGRNLGLGKWFKVFNGFDSKQKKWIFIGVVIEDQEGNTLPADKYFKNMDCLNNHQASQMFACEWILLNLTRFKIKPFLEA